MFKRYFTRSVLTFLIIALAAVANSTWGQVTPDVQPQEKLQAPIKMLVEERAHDAAGFDVLEAALSQGVVNMSFSQSGPLPSIYSEGNLLQVVILASSSEGVHGIAAEIERLGGIVETTHEVQIQAMLSLDALDALSAHPGVSFVRLPHRTMPSDISEGPQNDDDKSGPAIGAFVSEGVDVIGSPAWNAVGLDGRGVKAGIIDQFGGYRALMGIELPLEENVTIRSFARHGEIFQPDFEELLQDHGTNVGEIIYDIAPRASHHLAYIETAVEFQRAINWLISEEVNVINTSLGFESACYRGGGIFEPVLEHAKSQGVSWATSAGNEAASFLQADFEDRDEDGLHDFSAVDNANRIDVLVQELETESGERFGLATLRGVYSWDAPCTFASEDYEIVVSYENEAGERIELVEFEDYFDDWAWEPRRAIKTFAAFREFDPSRSGELVTFYVGVRKLNPDAPDVNFMINHSCACRIQYTTPEGSVSLIEPSVSPSTFTVAAAHHSSRSCPRDAGSGFYCPDGLLLYYSSQGPTRDGRQKPDIAAPTHVSTASSGQWTGQSFDKNPGFGGTSGASPHVAGAMALVTQALSLIHGADPSADDVFAFLTDRAEDVAGPGADLRYGAGLLHLGQPPDVEIDGETTGQLIATTFIAVEFVVPEDWRRDLDAGCMAYTNTSSEPSPIRVTRPDSTVSEYSIPPENRVLICENVVHVDTRDG